MSLRASAGERRRPCVLVVDDDPSVLRTLTRMLGSQAEVRFALGAEDALLLLLKENFDSVLVDFNMMGPNGAWLLRKVRTLYPRVHRILLSGMSYGDLAAHLDPGLVDRFLEKPLERSALFEAVLLTEAG